MVLLVQWELKGSFPNSQRHYPTNSNPVTFFLRQTAYPWLVSQTTWVSQTTDLIVPPEKPIVGLKRKRIERTNTFSLSGMCPPFFMFSFFFVRTLYSGGFGGTTYDIEHSGAFSVSTPRGWAKYFTPRCSTTPASSSWTSATPEITQSTSTTSDRTLWGMLFRLAGLYIDKIRHYAFTMLRYWILLSILVY